MQTIQDLEDKQLKPKPEASSCYDCVELKWERTAGLGFRWILRDEKGGIILPGQWEDIVRPGEKVILRFIDVSLNGQKGIN